MLAALNDADLLQVNWSEGGQQKGLDVFIAPLRDHPKTLACGVSNKKQAFALRQAKIEIDNGNYYAAYTAMRVLEEPAPTTTH